ncbi:MAG: molybdenum cofactor biosynthesis protein MoaE [Thermodesulfobacteriota bacterium]|nr:molybdenum cofactor biosynthesis protein MoaE [Thermodesulfobacteriota bacterium]
MDLEKMINRVKRHPDFAKAGMILCHNGVVRETAADGKTRVSALTATVDHETLARVIEKHRRMPGIIEVAVEIAEGRHLAVGDDIMLMVVAGDVRGNVFDAMRSLLDEVKSTVVTKAEEKA